MTNTPQQSPINHPFIAPFQVKFLAYTINNLCNHWMEACQWVKGTSS